MKIARIIVNISTQNIQLARHFYQNVLGFVDLIEKKDGNQHEMILRNANLSQNLLLRITQFYGETYIKPSEDHLFVFYLNNENLYHEITNKLAEAGINTVKSLNPYWDKVGKTYIGPDQYRIVFCPGNYKNYKARIARPTSNITYIEKFYMSNIKLHRIGGFNDHEGFDGIMLGSEGIDCHLEMTYQHHENENQIKPSGYGLEFICVDDKDEVKILSDTDNYPIAIISTHA